MLITDREQQKRYKQKNNKPLRQRAPKSSPPHKQKHLLQSHPNPGAFMTTQSHQRPGPSQQYDTKTISPSLYSSSSSLNNRGALSRRGRQHYGSRRAFGNLSEQTTPYQDVADQAVNAPSTRPGMETTQNQTLPQNEGDPNVNAPITTTTALSFEVSALLDEIKMYTSAPKMAAQLGITLHTLVGSYNNLRRINKVSGFDDHNHQKMLTAVSSAMSSFEPVHSASDVEERKKELALFEQKWQKSKADLEKIFFVPPSQAQAAVSSNVTDAPKETLPPHLAEFKANAFAKNPSITWQTDVIGAVSYKDYKLTDLCSALEAVMTPLKEPISESYKMFETCIDSIYSGTKPLSWDLKHFEPLVSAFNSASVPDEAVFDRGCRAAKCGRGSNAVGYVSTPILPVDLQVLTIPSAFILVGMLSALKEWKKKHYNKASDGSSDQSQESFFKEFDEAVSPLLQKKILSLLLSCSQGMGYHLPEDQVLSSHILLRNLTNNNGGGGGGGGDVAEWFPSIFHLCGPAGMGKSELINTLAAVCVKEELPLFLIESVPRKLTKQRAYFYPNDKSDPILLSRHRPKGKPSMEIYDFINNFYPNPAVILFDPIELKKFGAHDTAPANVDSRNFLFLPQSTTLRPRQNDGDDADEAKLDGFKSPLTWPEELLPGHAYMGEVFSKIIEHQLTSGRININDSPQTLKNWYSRLQLAPFLSVQTLRSYSYMIDSGPDNYFKFIQYSPYVSLPTLEQLGKQDVAVSFSDLPDHLNRTDVNDLFNDIISNSTTKLSPLKVATSCFLEQVLLRNTQPINFMFGKFDVSVVEKQLAQRIADADNAAEKWLQQQKQQKQQQQQQQQQEEQQQNV